MDRPKERLINRLLPKIVITLILFIIIIGIKDLHCQDVGKSYYFFYSQTLQDKIDLYTQQLPDSTRWIYQEQLVSKDELFLYTEISEYPYPIHTASFKDNVCVGYGTIHGVKKRELYGGYYYYSDDFKKLNQTND